MKLFKINPSENAAVALAPLSAGEPFLIDGVELTLTDAVTAYHKVALALIAAGEAVVKYRASHWACRNSDCIRPVRVYP